MLAFVAIYRKSGIDMKEMYELLEVSNSLMGPKGCPWDQKQTFFSLQTFFLEEVHEVIEAIDAKKKDKIIEELGDLLYVVIFCAKVAEKDGEFSIKDVIEQQKNKLIRRHPHVFGNASFSSIDDLETQWERIKKEEQQERKSKLDGIPKSTPLVLRVRKILYKIAKDQNFSLEAAIDSLQDDWSKQMFTLITEADDAEGQLRRALGELENKYREFEDSEKKLPESS